MTATNPDSARLAPLPRAYANTGNVDRNVRCAASIWISCRRGARLPTWYGWFRTRGQLAIRTELVIRFDYGSLTPWVTRLEDG